MTKRIIGNAPDLAEFVPALTHGKQYLHYWKSPEDLAAHCDKAIQSDAWHELAWREEKGDKGWHGSPNLAAAVALCRDGWRDGAERASKLRDRINADNPTGPRVVRYDVAGAYPIVPRALAGNPLSMRRVDSAKLRRRPVMTLVSDAAVNCMVDSAVQERRAAVVASVVDAIEAAGFACQVITTSVTGREQSLAAGCTVQVKDSSQPVDIARLAFALGHPAYLRRLCFVAYTENTFTKNLGGSLGSPVALRCSDDMRDRQVYLLPSCDSGAAKHFSDDETAATAGLKFILDSLAGQGCPAFPQQEANAA